jgi:hypothetical protein
MWGALKNRIWPGWPGRYDSTALPGCWSNSRLAIKHVVGGVKAGSEMGGTNSLIEWVNETWQNGVMFMVAELNAFLNQSSFRNFVNSKIKNIFFSLIF